MLKEAPGPINFTVFLTMFGEKLKGEGRCCFFFLITFVDHSITIRSMAVLVDKDVLILHRLRDVHL